MCITYSTAGTPLLTPYGEVIACPEEILMFTCQTHSRLRWMIQFEDISESNVEHVHLSGDQQRTTTIQDRNGIQFTFNLTTSDTNSSLLESTMTVIANHTLLNRAVVNCVGAGGVTTNTVIHMRGIKIVQRV